MLGLIKTDMKNLADISPLIDKDIIHKYNELYTESNVHKPNMVNGLSPVNIRVDTTDLPLPSSIEPISTNLIHQNLNAPNVTSSPVFPNQSGANNLNPPNLNGMSVSADLVIANVNSGSRRPSLHSNLNPTSLNVNISDSNSNSNNTPRQNPSINNVNESNNAADDAGAM